MFLIRGIARQITRTASGIVIPEIYLISTWSITPANVYRTRFKFSDTLTSDNLCFDLTKRRVSANLLLQTPEIQSFLEPLAIPEVKKLPSTDIPGTSIFSFSSFYIEKRKCSHDYLEQIKPPNLFEYLELLSEDLSISKNLFHPLGAPKIDGKILFYIDKETTDTDVSPEKTERTNTHKNNEAAKSPPSQIDLLEPILLPPLSLDFSDELEFYLKLRGYQQTGISFLVERPSALLADEMGTGKTVQTVTALRFLFRQGDIKSVLIVCPPAVIGSVELTLETGKSEGWCGHFHHWAPELITLVVHGIDRKRRKLAWESTSHVFITTYDTLRWDIQSQTLGNFHRFDCVVLDEAQKIKNQETKTSKAIRRLRSSYRWALTGTPVENSLDDIKSLFEFIQPGVFRGGVKETRESVKVAIEPYMLRRLKKDVLKELPPKIRKEDWLELTQEQKQTYVKALQDGKQKIQTSLDTQKTVNKTHIFALITKLKQLCNFSKNSLVSPKSQLLIEYLETIASNNQKAVVFSQYRKEGVDKISQLLEKHDIKYVFYTGKQKEKAINDFRQDESITVFLETLNTAGYGITLTEATYVIHFDHPWNPAKMNNAEDRIHRIGQDSSVTVYSFWMKGTVEERIRKKLKEKRLLIDETVNELAVEDIEQGISTDDWLDIFEIKPAVKTAKAKSTTVEETNPQSVIKNGPSVKRRLSKPPKKQMESTMGARETMQNDRLCSLEENLKIIREDIAGREKAEILAPFEEKTRIRLQIKEQYKRMRPLEEEYWRLLTIQAQKLELTETIAEPILGEIVEQTSLLKTGNQYPAEIIDLLQQIHTEVTKPGATASAKLKGFLSMIPPFIGLGYEVEIDTENFLLTHFPTFTKWSKALARK